MAVRQFQNYADSGELISLKIGGILPGNETIIQNDIETVVTTPAYCGFESETPIILTTVFQKISVWSQQLAPKGITETNGEFVVTDEGIYQWSLEKVFTNGDSNPSEEVIAITEVRKNGIAVVQNERTVGPATNKGNSTDSETLPYIFEVAAGDTFSFYVRGEDGIGVNPTALDLTRAQITANKIHNIV